MKFAIIIEKSENNYCAYVPELPGCISVGDTIEELTRMMTEAIQLHVESMREDGIEVPDHEPHDVMIIDVPL